MRRLNNKKDVSTSDEKTISLTFGNILGNHYNFFYPQHVDKIIHTKAPRQAPTNLIMIQVSFLLQRLWG